MKGITWDPPYNLRARLRKHVHIFPDEDVDIHWVDAQTHTLAPGQWVNRTWPSPGWNQMEVDEKYHWDWRSWKIISNMGDDITETSGREGSYECTR